MYLKRREFFIGVENRVFQHNRPIAAVHISAIYPIRIAANWLRPQPVDATHWLNRSAGVSKFNVFLGRALSCLATALSFASGALIIFRYERVLRVVENSPQSLSRSHKYELH